jgi:hypothetical protein
MNIDYLADDTSGGQSVSFDGDYKRLGQDDNWGNTGSTDTIATGVRFKIDDGDNKIAYLQFDADAFDVGIADLTGRSYKADVDLLDL